MYFRTHGASKINYSIVQQINDCTLYLLELRREPVVLLRELRKQPPLLPLRAPLQRPLLLEFLAQLRHVPL